MKAIHYLLPLLLLGAVTAFSQKKEKPNPNKEAVMKSVEAKKPDLTGMSDKIWAYAETALKEKQSSKLLADYAEAQGFKVDRGVAGLPTAFIAS